MASCLETYNPWDEESTRSSAGASSSCSDDWQQTVSIIGGTDSEDSGTESDSSSTGSTVGSFVGGAIESVAGPAVSEQSAALGATVGGVIAETTSKENGAESDSSSTGSTVGSAVSEQSAVLGSTIGGPIAVAEKRSLSPRGRDDDLAEIQSAKRKKGEESTISPYGDTCDTAKRHFTACGDRSGQPSNDTINTRERSQDNFMRGSLRSSKNNIGNQVSCSEERSGCLFKELSGINCNWFGSQSDLVEHSKEHNAKIQEEPEPLKVKLSKFSKARNFYKAIVLWGKLFYLLWVKTENTMHFLVYVIPKKASEEYTYDFKIKKGETEMSISGGKCSSLLQPQYEEIEKGDIIRLPCGKVQNYLDAEDNLLCVIEIRRQEGTSSSSKVDKTRCNGCGLPAANT